MLQKTTITLLFLFSLAMSCFGQKASEKLDVKLAAKYSNSEIELLKSNSKEQYDLYRKSFEKGVVLFFDNKVGQKESTSKLPLLNISLSKNEDFNYLAYGIELLETSQYFRINNGDAILLIRGTDELKILK